MDKRTLTTALGTRLINPIVRRLVERGIAPPSYAILETTGRRSGRLRRTPVGNGLDGDTFWIVAEHGRRAGYVRNIQADPRVRIKLGSRWMTGTARILPDDPPYERLRWLRRPVNDLALLGLGTEQLVLRVDLDPPAA